MKRFWVFVFDDWEPFGGMSDFRDSYDTAEEAFRQACVFIDEEKKNHSDAHSHIFDSEQKLVVWDSDRFNENIPESIRISPELLDEFKKTIDPAIVTLMWG